MVQHGRGGKTPHPFVSCGDFSKDEERVIVPAHIEKRVEAIFSDYVSSAPKEASSTHMMGGSENGFDQNLKRVIRWLPQNKRFYFAFDRFGFSPDRLNTHASRTALGMGAFAEYHDQNYTVKSLNSGSEWKVEGFAGCIIRIKKTQVEIIPSCLLNVPYEFVCVAHGDALSLIQSEIDAMMDYCSRALYAFSLVHGGSVGALLKATSGDDGISGDSFIDALEPELRFNNPRVKKQYPFKTEFKGSVLAGTYLSNAAVRMVAPEIVDELEALRVEVAALPAMWKRRDDPIGWIFSEGHNVMLNEMSSQDRSSWLRETFG